MAFVVDTMSAWHKDHRGSTGEHVLATNGAIAFQVALDTFVVAFKMNAHTDIALFAMKVIATKSLSNPADTAIVTVINVLFRVVVPQLANVAIVRSHTSLA